MRSCSDSRRLPGVFLTCFRSSGSSSYRSTSIGFGGSILFLMPSRPAINSAANVRYGLADGSGARNSSRLAFGDVEQRGRVLDQPADIPARRVGNQRVAVLVEEQVVRTIPQAHMHVHP